MIDLSEIPVVIMCGGLGKRMQSITKNKIPKCMLDIHGKPFLYYLINKVRSYGIKYIILSVGFKKEIIQKYCNEAFNSERFYISYSYDEKLIGTTNALLQTKKLISKCHSKTFLVMNGDTYFGFNLDEWIINCIEDGYMVRNYGCSFNSYAKGLNSINSGVYYLNATIFNILTADNSSKIEDFFRKLIMSRKFCQYRSAYEYENLLLDIGTPEGYEKTKEYFKK